MKFDSKHLIKWGIPGWVFMTWFLICGFGTIEPLTDMLVKEANFIKVIGLLITLLSIGVPVGYLFHQLYFSWEWISKEKFFFFFKRQPSEKFLWKFNRREPYKFLFLFPRPKPLDTLEPIKEKIKDFEEQGSFHEDYYQIESLWHSSLLKLESEKRDYIVGRVKYFLSTIHGLGSLMYSLATSLVLIPSIFWMSADSLYEQVGLAVIIAAHILLLWGIYKNHKYYSRNLIVFQANFLAEMLSAEKDKKEKIPEQTINIKFK